MDDIVRQAMLKWPNVPNCFGWLGLDARGNWYMRDDRSQSLGGFASGIAGAKGSLLQHAKLIEFIQRNYASDAAGQWYFQNGPQRVYVELEHTPWVFRIAPDYSVSAHDGRLAELQQLQVDEMGWLYAQTSIGFGLVHTQDVGLAGDAIEQGQWRVEEVSRSSLPARYGYVRSPQALQPKNKPAH